MGGPREIGAFSNFPTYRATLLITYLIEVTEQGVNRDKHNHDREDFLRDLCV